MGEIINVCAVVPTPPLLYLGFIGILRKVRK